MLNTVHAFTSCHPNVPSTAQVARVTRAVATNTRATPATSRSDGESQTEREVCGRSLDIAIEASLVSPGVMDGGRAPTQAAAVDEERKPARFVSYQLLRSPESFLSFRGGDLLLGIFRFARERLDRLNRIMQGAPCLDNIESRTYKISIEHARRRLVKNEDVDLLPRARAKNVRDAIRRTILWRAKPMFLHRIAGPQVRDMLKKRGLLTDDEGNGNGNGDGDGDGDGNGEGERGRRRRRRRRRRQFEREDESCDEEFKEYVKPKGTRENDELPQPLTKMLHLIAVKMILSYIAEDEGRASQKQGFITLYPGKLSPDRRGRVLKRTGLAQQLYALAAEASESGWPEGEEILAFLRTYECGAIRVDPRKSIVNVTVRTKHGLAERASAADLDQSHGPPVEGRPTGRIHRARGGFLGRD